MADRVKHQCIKCNHVFSDNAHLQRHLKRITPCEPILDVDNLNTKTICRFCCRDFTTAQALSRHIKHRCKIANSDEGMDKLMKHTLQKQGESSVTTALEIKMDNLFLLMERQTNFMSALIKNQNMVKFIADTDDTPSLNRVASDANHIEFAGATLVNGPVMIHNITNQIVINPWNSDKRINITVEDIIAVFQENPLLREYLTFNDHRMSDPEESPPFVAEFFIDLTRRAHATLESRNVYLNPCQTNQVLIYIEDGHWEVRPLMEISRLICDGIAKCIKRIRTSPDECKNLPANMQNAIAIIGMLYGDNPEEYAKSIKTPLSTHLSNTAPVGKC